MNHGGGAKELRDWVRHSPISSTPDAATNRRSGQLSGAGIIGIVCLSFVLFSVYGYRPLVAEPWQWADDGLYLRQAEAIVRWVHGDAAQWLGPYDALILSKAPLFAIWLAAVHILNLPLRLAEFALLLILPWLFRAAVRPVTPLSSWRFATTAILLVALPFLPLEQRLLRSVLQAVLSSACLIAGLGVVLRTHTLNNSGSRWAATTGLFFALAYLNREEAVWLLPSVFCAVVGILIGAWLNRSWGRGLIAATSLLVAAAIPIAAVSGLNYRSYGIFITTLRRGPEFIRAHQLMTRLEPGMRERYVPIRTETRLKAYAVSPTFSRLRSYLEGPPSDPVARNPGHLTSNGQPLTSREFFVSNFQQVLQEAAYQAGAHTARDSEAMFAAIADELESAIARGKVTAGQKGPATLGAPLAGDYRRIARQTLVSLAKLYRGDNMVFLTGGTSSGTPEDLRRMENMTHMALAPVKEMSSLDLPPVGAITRRYFFDVITLVEKGAYLVTTITLVGLLVTTVVWHRRDPTRVTQAFAALVLCGSMISFSFAIAVTDVLGFPILKWNLAYNTLGYAPLSVLSAFGLVILYSSLESLEGVALVRKGFDDERASTSTSAAVWKRYVNGRYKKKAARRV